MGIDLVYVVNLDEQQRRRRAEPPRESGVVAVLKMLAVLAAIGVFFWFCIDLAVTLATH